MPPENNKPKTKKYVTGPWEVTERPEGVPGLFRMMMVRAGWDKDFIVLYAAS